MRTRGVIIAAGAIFGGSLGPQMACSQEADTSAVATETGRVQEIVVTAERRSERLQDVPIAVAVVSAADAAKFGTSDNMNLSMQIPSLQESRPITGASIYLRGVGSVAAPGIENAVATYVDDVYITGFAGSIVSFNNIDHVEVLEGPQGTLFGRNATGGVINVVTKDPSATPELNVQLGYGNYNTIFSSVYGTTALAPNLAIDVAYSSREQRDGYGVDLTTGQDIYLGKEYGVRSKLKWSPGESTSVIVAVDHYWDNYDYGSNETVVPGTLSAGLGTYAGPYNSQGNNPYSPYGPGRSGHSRHVDGITLTLNHDFSWASVKSVAARREVRDQTAYDQDAGPEHFNDARWPSHLEQYSEELHLASLDGATLWGRKFRWLAGLYWLHLNDATDLSTSGGLLGGGQLYTGSSKAYTTSYAAFLDATLEVATDTNLTLGVRETEDRIKNRSSTLFVDGTGTPFVTPFPELTSKATKPTYRAVLDHKFTSDLMAYGSVSRGFKSGGFGLFGPGTPATLPEIVDAYALGLKSAWLDRRLQANFEGFYYSYKNQQVNVVQGGFIVELNAARSKIYGAEMRLTATPTDALTLFSNVGYLHGQYDNFPAAPIYLQNPATCDPQPRRLDGPLQPGGLQCAFDASGKPTIRSPRFTGNAGFDYTLKSDIGSVSLAGNYYYSSTFNWDVSGQYPEPAYGLLNGSVTWTSPSARFDAQLFCTNCANRYHNTFIVESGPSMQQAPADPRLYGIKVGMHL